MIDGKTSDGPSTDPVLRAKQELASRLDMLWQRRGGLANPEKCLAIRKECEALMRELQDAIKLPPRRAYNFKEE